MLLPIDSREPASVTPTDSYRLRLLRVGRDFASAAAAGAVLLAIVIVGWRYGYGAAIGIVVAVAATFVLLGRGLHSKSIVLVPQEAAPQDQSAILERLSLATQVGGISAWEFDVAERRFVWDTNRPKAFGLDNVPIESLAEKLLEATHPEDRTLMIDGVKSALSNEQNSTSHRFRIAREGHPIRHMQSFARIVKNASGKPARIFGATWDVTNEVQTTEMLQRQAEQERALLDRFAIATQAAGIRSWEMEFKPARYIWHDNFDLEWLLEHDPDPMKAVSILMHPDDRDAFRNAIGAAVAAKTDIVAYRYRFKLRNGQWDYRQNYARLFFDANSRPIRALGVAWSVTKEVEASEQLCATERRLERASLSSSEGHWEWDLVTQQAWHSASFHELLGYAQGRLLIPISDAVELLRHPDDAARHRDQLQQQVASGEPYVFEGRYRMATGEFRWFKVRGMSELDPSGKPIRAAGSIQDIHDQKLAEDALLLAQRRFERAINGTQDGLWEVEADGSGAWYSPRFCALLGYDENELAQQPHFLRSRIHSEDAGTVAEAVAAHYRENSPFDIEIRLLTKAEEYRWYRARAVAERGANFIPLRLSGSIQDVTEGRLAREELVRATEAAQAANFAKSAFIANVSHEIRTPMNGILGMTGLLTETELDRTQRDYAETIRTSADSLLTVINDILDFSKIEAGKLDIEALELDLRSNVEDVGGMMAFQAAAKKLELVVNIQGDVPPFVRGDPQRIRQCLINLVGNAIKFTRSGEVVIEVSNVGAKDNKTLTRFQVRDTGIGIAAESLRKLFQPFTQADSSTTRHFGGTGLGLSIVHRLVEMMGGETGATSELGVGSTFWFSLPLEAMPTPQRFEAGDAVARGKRILIVDDNHTNRRVLLGQLEHAGFIVAAAANGVDALAAMRQAVADARPFDVALIDFQMPEMDGAMVGEQINADAELSRTRTVMLTSMDRHGDMRQFAAMGFAGYLSKPVRSNELLACIDRVLAREKQSLITRGALQEQSTQQRFSGRVLLVEDNAINQKVARQFLLRLGCEVEIADNGEQGVKAFESGVFALVLMDLQMPIMDGYSATRRIRDFEGWRKRTPIVALTANAMAGQMERCIAAGMDDFLTKPLDVQRLRAVLGKFGLTVDSTLAPAGVDVLLSTPANAPVDLEQLLALTDYDPAFVRELVSAFVVSAAQIARELKESAQRDDRAATMRAAHKLRGASANLYARALSKLCAELETEATEWTRQEIAEQIAAIEVAIEQATDYLQRNQPESSDAYRQNAQR
jgi:PAS domain S-box-containing protein